MDWVPRYSGVAEKDQCKLTCQSRALGYYYVLEPRVSEGSPDLCGEGGGHTALWSQAVVGEDWPRPP